MLASFVFLKLAYALLAASTIARSADFFLARWVGGVSAKWGRRAVSRRREGMKQPRRAHKTASELMRELSLTRGIDQASASR